MSFRIISEAGACNIFFSDLHIYYVNSTTIILVKEANWVKINTRSATNGNLLIPKLFSKTGQRSFQYRRVHA